MTLPDYDALPIDPSKPPHSAWGVWGDDDELGAMNTLSPEKVAAAASLIRSGKVFSLNWALEFPDPPLYERKPTDHTLIPQYSAQDEKYDGFYPQASSQWDGLSHVGHPEYGFYNGRTRDDFTGQPGTKNGIEHMARRGVAGRGVLLDIERYYAHTGRVLDGAERTDITVDDLRGAADWHGVEIREGDILLIRTGWMAWYEQTDAATRLDLADNSIERLKTPGLETSQDMLRFLWNSHIAAAVSDNPGFESSPHALEVGEYMHFEILGLLGIPIGELWYLDALAEDCAADGRYEFFLTSAPLNKLGGVGSTANALAIK